jgi:hypothetical protein
MIGRIGYATRQTGEPAAKGFPDEIERFEDPGERPT